MTTRAEIRSPTALPGPLAMLRGLALAAVFAAGAWHGYGFGAQVAGPWLGTLAALNLGVMAVVAAASLVGWLNRRRRR